jgi:hypothetical protein
LGELDNLSSTESDEMGEKTNLGPRGERSKKVLTSYGYMGENRKITSCLSFDNAKTSTNRTKIERKMLSFVQKTQ